MSSETFTLYKLIICKMLNRVNFALSNAQICDYLLDRGYASYFDVQQSLNEMVEEELLTVQTRLNTSSYELTPLGRESLEYFGNQIPDVIVRDLDEYMRVNRYHLRETASVRTDYTKDAAGGFRGTVQLIEQDALLLEMKLHADTEDEATHVADRFKRYHKEVYDYLYEVLFIPESNS